MKKVQWYCKLCGVYNITKRLSHLIDYHNATKQRHAKRYREIIQVIFIEVKG